MKWQVEGMRRGRPGRWTIDASSRESAEQKVEAAGVTLGRIEPIGQITSATVAMALSSGRRAKARQPVGWIAACVACAVVFGAGGYFVGSYVAQTPAPATDRVAVPSALKSEPTGSPNTSGRQANDGSANKAEMSLSQGR